MEDALAATEADFNKADGHAEELGDKKGRKARAEYPELSRAPNIFVLADEARRAHELSAASLS